MTVKLDVFVLDLPTSEISTNYFSKWDFVAKSVDLRKKIDLSSQIYSRETGKDAQLVREITWASRTFSVVVPLLTFVAMIRLVLFGLYARRRR